MALFCYLLLFEQQILQNKFRSYLKRTVSERVTTKVKNKSPLQ